MNLQKELSSFYNKLENEYSPLNLKRTIDLDAFLLKYYFKNTEEVFIGIIETESAYEIYRNKSEKSHSILKSRFENDEDLKQTEKHSEILNFIGDNTSLEPEKSYDNTILKIDDNTYQLTFRFCKKSPLNFSLHEKKKEVYHILAGKFIINVMKIFTKLNISEEKGVLSITDQIDYYSEKLNLKKSETKNSDEIEYLNIFENAFLKISENISTQFPCFFENINLSSNKKIKWNADPQLFFLLFSVLIEEKYIKISNFGRDFKEITSVLYDFIDVSKKIGSKDSYKPDSFIQNLKPGSILQEDYEDYNQLKDELKDIFSSFK